jgi:hypothetical protein
MKSILDPTFRYTPSVETDVRRTFARIRRELRAPSAKAGVDAARCDRAAAPARQAEVSTGAR